MAYIPQIANFGGNQSNSGFAGAGQALLPAPAPSNVNVGNTSNAPQQGFAGAGQALLPAPAPSNVNVGNTSNAPQQGFAGNNQSYAPQQPLPAPAAPVNNSPAPQQTPYQSNQNYNQYNNQNVNTPQQSAWLYNHPTNYGVPQNPNQQGLNQQGLNQQGLNQQANFTNFQAQPQSLQQQQQQPNPLSVPQQSVPQQSVPQQSVEQQALNGGGADNKQQISNFMSALQGVGAGGNNTQMNVNAPAASTSAAPLVNPNAPYQYNGVAGANPWYQGTQQTATNNLGMFNLANTNQGAQPGYSNPGQSYAPNPAPIQIGQYQDNIPPPPPPANNPLSMIDLANTPPPANNPLMGPSPNNNQLMGPSPNINPLNGQPIVSDEELKKDVGPGEDKIRQFLESINAHSYRYKNPERDGVGTFTSPMAQELEKTELGKQAVVDTPIGKKVDYQRLGGVNLAAVAVVHKQQERLQAQIDDLRSQSANALGTARDFRGMPIAAQDQVQAPIPQAGKAGRELDQTVTAGIKNAQDVAFTQIEDAKARYANAMKASQVQYNQRQPSLLKQTGSHAELPVQPNTNTIIPGFKGNAVQDKTGNGTYITNGGNRGLDYLTGLSNMPNKDQVFNMDPKFTAMHGFPQDPQTGNITVPDAANRAQNGTRILNNYDNAVDSQPFQQMEDETVNGFRRSMGIK